MLLATIPLLLLAPLVRTPGSGLLLVLVLVAADLVVVFLFSRHLLNRAVLKPVDRMVESAERIAGGELDHRIPPQSGDELHRLGESMNAVAQNLIRNQRLLEENVASLDRTNRELVEATQEVVRSARLASVGTLAAGVAHEVGNPLGAVLGYLDVARRRAQRGEPVDELLEATRAEAMRIDRIIRSLLDFARPPRGGQEGSLSPWELTQRVRSLLETQGKLQGIRVEWEVDRALAPPASDPQFLEQVLVNLVLNAVDAVEGTDDPWIRVRLGREGSEAAGPDRDGLPYRRENDPPGVNFAHRRRWQQVRAGIPDVPEGTAGFLLLVVEDGGRGLPSGGEGQLFDPFFTTKEPGRGTGLGLAVCARLVAEMGGEIRGETVPDRGARFIVRIPLGRKEGA
ncbi:MAG: ATP-binding protein [Gemmatimonadota bacterium]